MASSAVGFVKDVNNTENVDIAGQAAFEGKHMEYGAHKLGARAYTDNPTRDGGFYYRGKLKLSVTFVRK
jgi:hypothetical protein